MDRRTFLTAQPKKIKLQPTVEAFKISRVQSGIQPYTSQWTSTEAIHLARRTMFGAKKSDVDYFVSIGMDQAVDSLLNVPSTQPAPPVKTYTNSTTPGDLDAAIPQNSTWVNINTNDGGIDNRRRTSFKSWWMGLMLNQDRNIQEKMLLMWHNIFASETQEINRGIWSYQNNLALRTNALGNFKTMVKAITLDTGMLRYLNGYLNTKTAPDENYARELQELFTIGKGIDAATAAFSEADVKAAARVLTGWTVDGVNNIPVFNLNKHDINNKQFSAFYNNTVITGRNSADAGNLELDDLLSMIFSKREVALHICRRIYRWMVYYDIEAATETNVIEPLADIFMAGNFEIAPLMSVLLKSQHFYDILNQGCLIKSPVDNAVGLCREFSVAFPTDADILGKYLMQQSLQEAAAVLQQNIGDPPSVAGWPAYYQRPQFHELWINSDTLPKRNQFSDLMNNNGYSRSGRTIKIDHTIFAASLPNPSDPNLLIKDSVKYLLGQPLSTASLNQLKTDVLLSGQSTDGYWTTAWVTFINTPGNTTNANVVKSRLAALYQYLLGLAEYQLS